MKYPFWARLGVTLCARMLSHRRAWGRRHLELALGQRMNKNEREKILNESLMHFFWMFWIFLSARRWSWERYAQRVRVEGEDAARLDAALARGQGVLLLTAHLGHWELGSRWIAQRAQGRTHVVAKDLRPAWLDRWLNHWRKTQGTHVIKKQDAARGVLLALKQGGVVAILTDQNRPEGVFVEFFGRLAGTSALPTALALRTGATILPTACLHEGEGKFRLYFLPPVDLAGLEERGKEEAWAEGTRRCNQRLEELILRFPSQWLWTHKRFKSGPPGLEPLTPLF